MPNAKPGDVWLIDLGMAAKTRPCLLLSDYPADDELALFVLVPHTTSVRNNRWELAIPKPFLKPGVFHLQQIQSIPLVRLQHKLGQLSAAELQRVRQTLVSLLRLLPSSETNLPK
ncbi:MAG TPA: type II toxin-antitoxin system PemK/MazF family toxin [Planctomycetaceae bacterium]|jgi:mRNA interferase MazF|nr:type II toxin-antitoxin system PemK/MazF family toxin [Planctomycetaceae bacterium]